jgi:hypothetical protein
MAILSTPHYHWCGESIFDYEYLCKFKVKIKTIQKLVKETYAKPIYVKKNWKNGPFLCPFKVTVTVLAQMTDRFLNIFICRSTICYVILMLLFVGLVMRRNNLVLHFQSEVEEWSYHQLQAIISGRLWQRKSIHLHWYKKRILSSLKSTRINYSITV